MVEEDWREKCVFVRLKGKELEGIYNLVITTLRNLNKDLKETKFLNKLEFETTILFENEYHKIPIFLRLQQDEKFLFLSEDEKINLRHNPIQMKQTKVHPTIQKAIQSLQNADYAAYFENLDAIQMPLSLKLTYAAHKGKFINGKTDWDFPQQLAAFTTELNNQLNPSSNSTTMQNPNTTNPNNGGSNTYVTVNPVFNNNPTITTTTTTSQHQQIDFKQFVNALEKVHNDLSYLKFDIEKQLKKVENQELSEAKEQIEETVEEIEAIKVEAEKAEQGDEEAKKNLKKNKVRVRYLLDQTFNALKGITKFVLNPTNMENAKKSINTGKEILEQINL